MAINVNTYNKHNWVDNSSPDLEAEILNEIETGIKDNNDAAKAIVAAVTNQISNAPDKIAGMPALNEVNQALGTLSTTVANLNSNLADKFLFQNVEIEVSSGDVNKNVLHLFNLPVGVSQNTHSIIAFELKSVGATWNFTIGHCSPRINGGAGQIQIDFMTSAAQIYRYEVIYIKR